MKKFRVLLTLTYCLLATLNLFADKTTNHGIVGSFYNEPLIKPGFTIGFDSEIELTKSHRLGIVMPEITYFYFQNNYQALYLYPEMSYRFISKKGFYTGISFGSGLSLSQKIVPLYNLDGDQIDPKWNTHLFLKSVISLGWDFERAGGKPFRLFFNIGWKGIYPDNLGVLNQPILELGIKHSLFKKDWK